MNFEVFELGQKKGGGSLRIIGNIGGVLGRRPVSEGSGRVLNPVIFDTTLFPIKSQKSSDIFFHDILA